MGDRFSIKSFFALALVFLLGFGIFQYVLADDDEEEDRYEQNEDKEDDEDKEDEDDKEDENKTVTEVVRLPDKIVTRTIIENIIKKDSDRDGLLDEKDPHPDIAEIYIVKDDDKNGIDDKYDLKY
ncbi:MAG: hypothetical protein ACD_56C00048G0003 [uncultured bacterium]|nr:MAG: hypothetical protein ACD_56C00048G0003 [uncultured bacterium]